MPDMKDVFSSRLKKARIGKGVTQAELSRLASLTPATVSAYEKGQKLPNLSSTVELARALGVTIDWLCGEETTSEQNINVNNEEIDFSVLARLIVFLGMNCCSKMQIVEQEETYIDHNTGYPTHGTIDVARLVFDQEEIIEFISGFIKLKQIYEDDVLSKELFDTSINGLIDKYKSLYISNKIIGDRDIDAIFEQKKAGEADGDGNEAGGDL